MSSIETDVIELTEIPPQAQANIAGVDVDAIVSSQAEDIEQPRAFASNIVVPFYAPSREELACLAPVAGVIALCTGLTAMAARNLGGAPLVVVLAAIALVTLSVTSVLTAKRRENDSEKQCQGCKNSLESSNCAGNNIENASQESRETEEEPSDFKETYRRGKASIIEFDEISRSFGAKYSQRSKEESEKVLEDISKAQRLGMISESLRLCHVANQIQSDNENVLTHSAERAKIMGNMAHEIKTPLTSLRLVAEGMEDGIYAPGDGYAIESITNNIERIDSTVKMMSRYAKCKQGLIQQGSCDCIQTLAQVTNRARELASVLGVEVFSMTELETFTDTAVSVNVSERAFNDIVMELVSNALRHARGITKIELSLRIFEDGFKGLSCPPDTGIALIEVRDDGDSLSPEVLSKMTEPFWKGDKSHSLEDGAKASPGLGLSIVSAAIEACGGKLEIESENGTSVIIALPLITSTNEIKTVDQSFSSTFDEVMLG